jgi:hypothetical protein
MALAILAGFLLAVIIYFIAVAIVLNNGFNGIKEFNL